MGESRFTIPVQPGVLAAILFIGLDIFTLGILDIVLSRVLCLVYHRKINRGRPVAVQSADIPGLTNYLLGNVFSPANLIAIGIKLSLLALFLIVNVHIDSETVFEKDPVQRTAVFQFAPSDAEFERSSIRTVRRRPEISKACIRIEDDGPETPSDKFTFYQLAFNLRDNVELPNDVGVPGVDTTGQYDIDDTSIICMSPANVHNEQPIVTVLGCTRRFESSCLSVISGNDSLHKPVTARVVSDEPWTLDSDEPTHSLTVYDPVEVAKMFSEYEDPVLTCLSTEVGTLEFGGSALYRNCLMVSHNATTTVVERWLLYRNEGPPTEDKLVLDYPGVIFEGDVRIEQRIAALYLKELFQFTTYRSLSGQLVAYGAKFASKKQTVVRNGAAMTVTTIPVWTVVLVAIAVVLVVGARVVTFFLVRRDERPKLNTINGLSSIVREECQPSGRSYVAGASAKLGLRHTDDDQLHFGPLAEAGDGAHFDDVHAIF